MNPNVLGRLGSRFFAFFGTGPRLHACGRALGPLGLQEGLVSLVISISRSQCSAKLSVHMIQSIFPLQSGSSINVVFHTLAPNGSQCQSVHWLRCHLE